MSSPSVTAKVLRFYNAHWPRYIFIHINKTAGSSIEQALNLRFEHKTARQKRLELGERRWASAFKFALVRNPWDKVVSHYHYRVKTNQTGMGDGHIDFRDWVHRAYGDRESRYYDQPMMFMPQVDWLTDEQGQLIVDFIGRFETLSEDFSHICKRVGIAADLPRVKATRHRDYKDLYDDATRDIVADRFAADCQEFGYRF